MYALRLLPAGDVSIHHESESDGGHGETAQLRDSWDDGVSWERTSAQCGMRRIWRDKNIEPKIKMNLQQRQKT